MSIDWTHVRYFSVHLTYFLFFSHINIAKATKTDLNKFQK